MVRIFKGLYINPLTVVFFVVCYLSGKSQYFLISYISMIFHELAHLISACFIGLKPSHISLHPFGVNLKLKSNIVSDVVDDIILYVSGPLVNLILALLFITLFRGKYLYEYGFAVNIMLFITNFLPVCPLDGGNVIKRILSQKCSEYAVSIIMKTISAIISVAIFAGGVYLVYVTGYNYSVLFISVLIFANIFTSSEKYSEAALKNLIFEKRINKNKTGKPVRMYTSEGEAELASFLKYIRPGVFTCVALTDKNGEIIRLITEKELIKKCRQGIDFKNNLKTF